MLILTPVAVKTKLQRQHISKDILEYGFDAAKKLGFKAILVEGDPRNYNNRGFQSSYKFGIEAGPNIKLPHPDCLMVKELEKGISCRAVSALQLWLPLKTALRLKAYNEQ